jgi:sugar porter (SP) family MFS transporter
MAGDQLMHGPSSASFSPSTKSTEINLRYLWLIAFVAALGGLLFGYDWVVIGGAKDFYQAYFHLSTEVQVGWANSCALIGCFMGSLAGGRLSDYLGRRRVLLISGLLFAVSSVLTGWSHQFSDFIVWRIVGGVAIGLASNVSPTYLAEISPAQWRGRLVSLNQLALVIGILLAQIVNWGIARRVPAGVTVATLTASWNVQFGWRWMFTAVAIPSLIFLIATPFIPESPRWLVARGQADNAALVLTRIGGASYSRLELEAIQSSLPGPAEEVPWSAVLRGRVFRLLLVGIALAVLQQGSGINILFNYAEDIYRSAGYGMNEILFNIVITGAINLIFTVLAMLLVDKFGRRRLMLCGCLAIGICHIAASIAYRLHLHGFWILGVTLTAIACYAMTLAPITWVLITEIFPNRYRGTAVSISVATLWIASFGLTYTFPALQSAIGSSGTFLVYAGICFAGALLVLLAVPETRGRPLESIGAES